MAQTFDGITDDDKTLLIIGGIVLLFILAAASSASGSASGSGSSNQNTRLPATPDHLRRYEKEIRMIRQAAEPFRGTRLPAALFKYLCSRNEHQIIERIDIGTESFTIRYRNAPDETLPYSRMGIRNLRADDCIPCACALQEKIGDRYHIRFQDGQLTPSVILNPYDLKDPKEKLTP